LFYDSRVVKNSRFKKWGASKMRGIIYKENFNPTDFICSDFFINAVTVSAPQLNRELILSAYSAAFYLKGE